MANGLLGRTNRTFPPVWLRLAQPSEPASVDWAAELCAAAQQANVPIDISSQPALWGGWMRGTEATLLTFGVDLRHATDDKHAADLTQAHLIETLSAVGRETMDFYFLRIRSALEEVQINGALEALESARQEGHVRYVGIYADGPPMAALGVWQFHDAFDVLAVRRSHADSSAYDVLAPLARERRVGILTTQPLDWGDGIAFTRAVVPELDRVTVTRAAFADLSQAHPVLTEVRTPEDVALALAASEPFEGPQPDFQTFLHRYRAPSLWREIEASSHDDELVAVARRRGANV